LHVQVFLLFIFTYMARDVYTIETLEQMLHQRNGGQEDFSVFVAPITGEKEEEEKKRGKEIVPMT